MSPEERQLLTGLFDRIKTVANNPRDREAETLIAEAVKVQPYAPYLMAQTVLVQEQALSAANERLQQLEAEVQALKQQVEQQPAQSGGFLSGLGSLFGGGVPPRPSNPPPPYPGAPNNNPGPNNPSPWGRPPQAQAPQPSQAGWSQQPGYAQPPQAGPWGAAPPPNLGPGQGGGFLKGALGAAAGVAGGVLLADSIKGLFGGHNSNLGIGSGLGNLGTGGLGSSAGLGENQGGGETIINNYYGSDAPYQQADSWQDGDHYPEDTQNASDYGGDYDNSGDDDSYDV
ncbi:DUF2076 domain-containing protein [Beijerinckia indica]|uniref:Putative periplasmic ligand-binding sensor protein n=1 Tax=Beijerinckia indica subsp. indica (strain ATCC 9039 / DSM 1715 / NCIMB 8712) TaxID=395963 RepID=B2IDG9_BEII9|nr:DUF2076 domain-containing protein [Beijerinckia indica]ACB95405.1 putative periplasmic ligand-binding sensor protein [Beijerinckia indica subsp. indica ATCC 9039]